MVAVIDAVEQHTERIQVDRRVRRGGDVGKLRCGERADIFLRQAGVFQILQRDQTEVTEQEFSRLHKEDVFGLQVAEQVAGLAAGGDRVAKVDAEIDRAQMRHGVLGKELVQRDVEREQYVDIIAYAGLLWFDLVGNRACEAAGGCKRLAGVQLGADRRDDAAVVFVYGGLVGVCAGEDQRAYLTVGRGDGKTLEDKSFAGRAAEDIAGAAAVCSSLLLHRHLVKQGRDHLKCGHRLCLLKKKNSYSCNYIL